MPRLSLLSLTVWTVLAAALLPGVARADRVLVLELENDSEARVRHQLESALDRAHKVERLSLEDYTRLARQKGVAKERWADASVIQELAPALGVTALLTGSVGSSLTVRILDANGALVWSKQLPSVGGKLSDNHAKRLAAALGAAGTSPTAPRPQAAAGPPSAAPVSESPHPQAVTHAPPPPEPAQAPAESAKSGPASTPPEPAKPVASSPAPQPPPQPVVTPPSVVPAAPAPMASAPVAPPAATPVYVAPPPTRRASPPPAVVQSSPRSSVLSSQPTYDYPLDYPARGSSYYYAGYAPPRTQPTAAPARASKPRKKASPGDNAVSPRFAPKYFRLELGALGVLRSYCARPGVTTGCVGYDSLPASQRPPGPTADFGYQNIYPGGSVSAELFPLAGLDETFLRGIGLLGGYARAWSTANQPTTTASGTPTQVPVSAIDERYFVMAAYRYYFGWDSQGPVSGFIGVRFGFVGRGFLPQSPAGVFLPATRRAMWAVGLDLQLPFIWWMKLDLGGLYYLGNGVSVDDAVALGSQDASIGFSAWGGFSGDFAQGSPFGYFVRAQWDRFDERFGAGGTAWPNGGSAQETYITLSAGLSLAF